MKNYNLTHLKELEAEAIYIMREVFEPSERDLRMVRAASEYADGEPLD